ncbi:MAG: HAMP domain-containing histidine kinase [Lachnospiraceae bacterium]|nr:HAMP domain-containing histidine kinase [Lachnospiraceae bacterium]
MKYFLILSMAVNIILLIKLLAMRIAIRALRIDFSERKDLRSNRLLGAASRDREIRKLTKEMNETLVSLREAFRKYETGDAEIKTAVTNIAHDLRTPLTAICGYLELSEGLEKSPELAHHLSVIAERAEHMKKLTEELFEYALLSGGEIREERQELCINTVLEDALMNYYPAFSGKGIEPQVEITGKKIVRSLIPSYVERIISNLLSNALKYSDGDLWVSLSEEGKLCVANSAAGLSTIDVNRLFDRFFTVETARNHSTGLGLSIVKLFAERMDCGLDAEYRDGKLIIEITF